jgi:hypothetical protein
MKKLIMLSVLLLVVLMSFVVFAQDEDAVGFTSDPIEGEGTCEDGSNCIVRIACSIMYDSNWKFEKYYKCEEDSFYDWCKKQWVTVCKPVSYSRGKSDGYIKIAVGILPYLKARLNKDRWGVCVCDVSENNDIEQPHWFEFNFSSNLPTLALTILNAADLSNGTDSLDTKVQIVKDNDVWGGYQDIENLNTPITPYTFGICDHTFKFKTKFTVPKHQPYGLYTNQIYFYVTPNIISFNPETDWPFRPCMPQDEAKWRVN